MRHDDREAFVDPSVVHTAYNPSDSEETVVIATFVGTPAGTDLATPIDPDRAEELNDMCGTAAATPGAEGASRDH